MSENTGVDIQIIALLSGEPPDVAAGINWAHEVYCLKICGELRRRFPYLPASDLPDVWQDTLLSLFRMAENGKFDRNGSLSGLIYRIAVCRAWDRLRRVMQWKKLIEAISTNSPGVRTDEEWKAEQLLEREELVESIQETVSQLPPRQNCVWRVYLEHFPRSLDMGYLTDKVREEIEALPIDSQNQPTDVTISKKAVTSALYAGRVKVRRALNYRGFDL